MISFTEIVVLDQIWGTDTNLSFYFRGNFAFFLLKKSFHFKIIVDSHKKY